MVLTKMKYIAIAETYIVGGKDMKNSFITPGYFNDSSSQSQATQDAGSSIDGLNVLRIINEPVAGAPDLVCHR